MNLRFFVDHENLLLLNPCGEVSNGIILPISKSPNEGIAIWREQPLDKHHHVGFDVPSFLEDFLLDGREEFFRLC